jgi:hypothetical protein
LKKIREEIGMIEITGFLLSIFLLVTVNRVDYFIIGLEWIPYIILPGIIVYIIIKNNLYKNKKINNVALLGLVSIIFIDSFSEKFSLGSNYIILVGKMLYLYVIPALLILSVWRFFKANGGENLKPENGIVILVILIYFMNLIN